MDTIPRPEKRKAEDDVNEEPHKRPLKEESTEYALSHEPEEAQTSVKIEEYEPTSYEQEPLHQDEEEEEAYEPTPIKEEPVVPLETVVPFDRLIVLHLEATCDENPTNPAAIQVTKENSEIIGKYP